MKFVAEVSLKVEVPDEVDEDGAITFAQSLVDDWAAQSVGFPGGIRTGDVRAVFLDD